MTTADEPTWTGTLPAAKAVVLNVPPADARELLECLGLIVPGGHSILPDDTRNYDVEGNAPDSGSTIGWRKVAPEPRADRRFVPDGLAS